MHLTHLIKRFFSFLIAEPLTPSEQQRVRGVLSRTQAAVFFSQCHEDQRHALTVMESLRGEEYLIMRCSFDERDLERSVFEAALLHDVGKTSSGLGAVARSIATLLDSIGFTLRGRLQEYLEHGEIGARELERIGAGQLAVAFARGNPGEPPEWVDPVLWRLLIEADNA